LISKLKRLYHNHIFGMYNIKNPQNCFYNHLKFKRITLKSSHMSQFAADYMRFIGELPSVTF
jgi:hypothetical protein